MAKGNLFLGYGRGKVGDVVFSRQNGEQVTRARNRAPRNPQSALQMLQRVIMKTNSAAYSLLKPICDHAFQGYQTGTPNQSRFAELNVALMRNQMRDAINSGDPEEILMSQEYNFNGKTDVLPAIREYQVSEGTLALPVVKGTSGLQIKATGASAVTGGPTYQDMCDALGLQKGDQLTFLFLTGDDSMDAETFTFNGLKVARVILEPNDGDMTSKFLDGQDGLTGHINKPNAKNEGVCSYSFSQSMMNITEDSLETSADATHTLMGSTVIASRLTGGVWERSTSFIALVDPQRLNVDHNIGYMQDAIYSYLSGTGSTLYLNQAE